VIKFINNFLFSIQFHTFASRLGTNAQKNLKIHCIMKKLTFLIFVQGLLFFGSQLRADAPVSILSKYCQGLDKIITFDSSNSVIREIGNYFFDSENNDRLVSCVEKVGGSTFLYEYGYDACGNQTSYTIKKSGASSFQFEEGTVYDSDCENPLVLSYFCEGIPEAESSAFKSEYISYQYSSGKIVKSEKRNGPSSVVIQEVGYDYYSNGKIKSISYKNLEDNIWGLTSKIEYTYPASGNTDHFETEIVYKYYNNSPVQCIKTTYDSSTPNQTTTTIEYFDETGINCITKEVRVAKYATMGVDTYMTECKVYVYNDNMLTPSNVIVYDNDGNIESPNNPSGISSAPAIWVGTWSYDTESGIDTYTVRSNDTSSKVQWSMNVLYDPQKIPVVEIRSELLKPGFKIYPNPVEDYLYVERNNSDNFVPIHYAIYNLTGKLQLRGVILSEKAFADVKTLSSGSYIISFTAENEKGTSVFIKK